MPLFECAGSRFGEEKRIDSIRPTFKRGRRLKEDQYRRIRDQCVTLLHSMGMSLADVAGVFSQHISERQCRNRIEKMPPPMKSTISKLAREVIAFEKLKAQEEIDALRTSPADDPE
jgi:hypothetical protein